jgi:ABC-2 type transport system ATP-binding protein
LLTRTAGESSILGFDSMNDSYEIRQRIGYIAQQNVLPGDMTVMENMNFFAGIQGMSKEDQKKRIPELLEFAGLSDFTGRLSRKLSGGMKKKLALACSLIHEPQVVMLDEPTLGVDPVSRREFWNLLGNLRAERGLTIFVNTPYMDEAERCTQIGLIYAGKMIASGTPADIKALVPGHVLEFTPGDSAAALSLINGMKGILEVQTYGEKLHVFVDELAQRKVQIEAALSAAGISHNELRPIETRMEEAFISLVQRQKLLAQDQQPETAGGAA